VGKLLAVAKELLALEYQLTFVGTGTALELAKHFPFTQIVECDVGDPVVLAGIRDIVRSGLGVVNVLEPVLGGFLQEEGRTHFYLDSLFWMWPEPDARVTDSSIYFIQRFPGVEQNLTRWSGHLKNPMVVGPIVDSAVIDWVGRPSTRSDRLVVNYAGLESALVGVDRGLVYPYVLTAILMPIIRTQRAFSEVVFTGNQRVMQHLGAQFAGDAPRTRFLHLSHDRFIDLLASSKCLLTSPGLTATYEAFLLGTPVRFLPPQNYSQTLMLDYYRREKLVDLSLHWRDLYEDYGVGTDRQEVEAVKEVLDTVGRFLLDQIAQRRAADVLTRMIASPLPKDLEYKQLQFARSMGPPAARLVAETIQGYVMG